MFNFGEDGSGKRVYNVKDSEGNVVDNIIVDKNSEQDDLYQRQLQTQGFINPVYDAGKEDAHQWVDTSTVEAKTAIDPMSGRVFVKGPQWLVDSVLSSESFKKEYLENKNILSVVNAYRVSPNAVFPKDDGTTMSVTDALAELDHYGSELARSVAGIKTYQMGANRRFGVDLSETQVGTATTNYDKKSYKDTDVIYIPDWAVDNYDWKSLDSWDEQNKAVSAGDFFKVAYKESATDKTASSLQSEVLGKMVDFLNNNSYDLTDEELKESKVEELTDSKYGEEFSRTIQMRNLLFSNRPDVDAVWNAHLFANGMIQRAINNIGNLGYSLSATVIDVMNALDVTDDISPDSSLSLTKVNPLYWVAVFNGEMIQAIQNGENPIEIVNGIIQDMGELSSREVSEEFRESQQALYKWYSENVSDKNKAISGAWSAGEFFGDLSVFIAEQTAINAIGGGVAKITKLPAIMSFLSKAGLSSKNAAAVLNTVAGLGNWGTQALIETALNNPDMIHNAMKSGKLSEEVYKTFGVNFLWNAGSELAFKGGNWLLHNTTPGRFINASMTKAMAGVSYYRKSAMYKIFKTLNGKSIATPEAAKSAGKMAEYVNTNLYKVQADVSKMIMKMPLLKALDPEMQKALDKSFWFVVFGKDAETAMKALAEANDGGEVIKALAENLKISESSIAESMGSVLTGTEEGAVRSAADIKAELESGIKKLAEGSVSAEGKTVGEAAEEAGKALIKDEEKAAKSSLRETFDKNWDNLQKAIVIRANLENQIDALTKGVSIMMTDIEGYTGSARTAYYESISNVTKLERSLSDAGKIKVTYGNLRVMSKESAEYVGFSTQRGRVAYIASNPVDATGAAKYAASEVKKAKEYLEAVDSRLAELSSQLGEEMVASLDTFRKNAATYSNKIIDYMISNKFVSEDYANLVKNLRNDVGWGKDGEFYLPTMRIFGDSNSKAAIDGLNEYTKGFENGEIFRTKTVGDDPRRYMFGDVESSFVDPINMLYSQLRGAATVAQAAKLGRALESVAIPVRALNGFTSDGIEIAELAPIQKDIKKIKSEISGILNVKGDKFQNLMKEAYSQNKNVTTEAIHRMKGVENLSRAESSLEKAQKEGAKEIAAATKNVEEAGASYTKLKAEYDSLSARQGELAGQMDQAKAQAEARAEAQYQEALKAAQAETKVEYEALFTTKKTTITGKTQDISLASDVISRNAANDVEKFREICSTLNEDEIKALGKSSGYDPRFLEQDAKYNFADMSKYDVRMWFKELNPYQKESIKKILSSSSLPDVKLDASGVDDFLERVKIKSKVTDVEKEILKKCRADFLSYNADSLKSNAELTDYLMSKSKITANKKAIKKAKVKAAEYTDIGLLAELRSVESMADAAKKALKKAESSLNRTSKSLEAKSSAANKKILAKAKRVEELAEFKGLDTDTIRNLGDDIADGINNILFDEKYGLVDNIVQSLEKNEAFSETVEKMVRAGASQDDAARYIVLNNLRGKDGNNILKDLIYGNFGGLVDSAIGRQLNAADKVIAKAKGVKFKPVPYGEHMFKKYRKLFKDQVLEGIEDEYRAIQGRLVKEAQELVDMNDYFDGLRKAQNEIMAKGFTAETNGKIGFNNKKYLQLVAPDGKLRYYEVDPIYAEIGNYASPSFFYKNKDQGPIKNFLYGINNRSGALFRWGQTGIDTSSYVNQWFRDPGNGWIIAGASPFTDLRPRNIFTALLGDSNPILSFKKRNGEYLIPKVGDIIDRASTLKITDALVERSYDVSRAGLIDQFGEKWVKEIEEAAASGLAGDAALAAKKRSVVEYAMGTSGMDALPGMGGMTEAKFYSSSLDAETTGREMRSKYVDALFNTGDAEAANSVINKNESALKKIDEFFGNFYSNTSKGNFREEFVRKNVYATQYKNAIDSGMTMAEAKIWAERYALDATTDFGRTFAYANDFIKSVPYLSAAINANRSFMRLLEMDPAGITSRIIGGFVIPYMSILSRSLSSKENREAYKNVLEYEKEDSLIFVFNGDVVSIPLPQEVSGFLAPFRQMVEKSANVNDISWNKLLINDALGMLPLDLSGFVNLDANMLASDENGKGIWSNIERGTEKALSSLMPPLVKSLYMLKSGRDPYTGQKIDTSRVTTDEEGNTVIMDSTKSEFAQFLHSVFPDAQPSVINKICQSIGGRSVMTVLDEVTAVLQGYVDDDKDSMGLGDIISRRVGDVAEAAMKPTTDAGKKNKASYAWSAAVSSLYEEKNKLLTDDKLRSLVTTLNTTEVGTEAHTSAYIKYRAELDGFARRVLDVTKAMKEKYPEAYNKTRVAQVVNLLTMYDTNTYLPTAASQDINNSSYYQARNAAIDTLINMGFPADSEGVTLLGKTYYDKNGKIQVKMNTPYEIQQITNMKLGAPTQYKAMIEKAIKNNDLNRSEMFGEEYQKAREKGKSALKEYKAEWNQRVVLALYPIFSKYDSATILNDFSVRDLLDNYLFVDNPFKTKEFLEEIFSGRSN